MLTRQSSIRTTLVADILSLRRQWSTHGKGPLKLLVFWKLLEDLVPPSLSDDIPTARAIMRTPDTPCCFIKKAVLNHGQSLTLATLREIL